MEVDNLSSTLILGMGEKAFLSGKSQLFTLLFWPFWSFCEKNLKLLLALQAHFSVLHIFPAPTSQKGTTETMLNHHLGLQSNNMFAV